MILANHMGEDLLPTLLAGGAGSITILAAMTRARLREFFRRLRSTLRKTDARSAAEAAFLGAGVGAAEEPNTGGV